MTATLLGAALAVLAITAWRLNRSEDSSDGSGGQAIVRQPTHAAGSASEDKLRNGPARLGDIESPRPIEPGEKPGSVSETIRDDEWAARRDPSLDSLTVLSPEWVSKYFEFCTGEKRAAPMNCTKVRNLAVSLAQEQKGETDSWPHRQEFMLEEFAVSAVGRAWISGATTACNRKGCLMYVTIKTGKHGSDYGAFLDGLEGQSWMQEFRQLIDAQSRRPRPFSIHPLLHSFAKTPKDTGYLMIFLRAEPSTAGST